MHESYTLTGPFTLHEHLYNTRTGSVFKVTDKADHVYALKVFTYGDELPAGHKERRLFDYANERSFLVNITRESCPSLLNSLSNKEEYGKSVDCPNHHLQLLLGLDVPVFDTPASDSPPVGMRKMRIMNSVGEETDRQLDFGANTLLPYMAGGRLNDLIARVPKYQSMVVRYPLYVDVAPQLVEAVRYLHSIHIAHLGIQTSTVMCSNVDCEDAVLTDPSNAWNGQGSTSAYANELMQQSVRFAQFASPDDEEEKGKARIDSVAPIFAKYLSEDAKKPDWASTLKVDWYGLGGTLFYVLAGIRPVAEDRSGPNSHDAAEFIYKALQSKQLLNKVPSEEAKVALSKIRDQVAEGLLLVDGLLQTDRTKRISFDAASSVAHATKSLRSSKLLMSALEVDKTGSCMKFLAQSAKESATLAELPVGDKTGLPSFLQDICH